MTFDLDQFVADCRGALSADRTHKSVQEVVARVVSDPESHPQDIGGSGFVGGSARFIDHQI